jgi:tetratricopeptide (TPR) repeat protein
MSEENLLNNKGINLAKNPLGIISLFVFFIEAIATVSLNIAIDTPYAGHIVWFIILFPTLIVCLFFGTLWVKRESLYAPMDFSDPRTFHDLLRPMEQKVDKIAAKQEAADIDPVTAELDEVYGTLGKLVELGDTRSAIELGRAYLKKDRFDESAEIFTHLKDSVEPTDQDYYKIMSNLGYSLIGQQKYDQAIDCLSEVENLGKGTQFRAWHSVAIAYAYFKLNDQDRFKEWLRKSKKMPEYRRNIDFFKSLYPEISDDL